MAGCLEEEGGGEKVGILLGNFLSNKKEIGNILIIRICNKHAKY